MEPLVLATESFFSSPRNVIRVVAVILLLAGTYGQLMLHRESAPVADSTLYDVAMTFTTPAGSARQRAQVRAGQMFNVAADDQQENCWRHSCSLPKARTRSSWKAGSDAAAPARRLRHLPRASAPRPRSRPQAESGAAPCALEMVVTKLAEAAPPSEIHANNCILGVH